MGVVIALDPGGLQGPALDRLTRELQAHEIVVVTSGDAALAALDRQVPDLLLFPLVLASRDEVNLESRLAALASPAELEALTIPLRAFFDDETQADRTGGTPPRWFYWFKPAAGADFDVTDARAFADAVRARVQRPRLAGAAPPVAVVRPLPTPGTWTSGAPEQPATPEEDGAGTLRRLAGWLPRSAWIAAPVLAIMLTLGVTGMSEPLRWAGALKATWFPSTADTGTAEILTVPDRVTPGGTGTLRIETEPAGALVVIDGTPRGVTPLTAEGLPVGTHRVDLTAHGNIVHETVDITGSKTTTLSSSVYQGWLALFSPIELVAAVDGRSLTLDDQNRVLLQAGRHELRLQSQRLGYLNTRTIEIRPGKTTAISVVVPRTSLTVTASSIAEVWIDGVRVGKTPIVNLPVELGTRDVVLRTPGHPERRLFVTATVAPVRIAVDLTIPVR